MSKYCSDCGCKTSNGVCSNCQEEYYIMENQSEFIEGPLSDQFVNKAKAQKKYLEALQQG